MLYNIYYAIMYTRLYYIIIDRGDDGLLQPSTCVRQPGVGACSVGPSAGPRAGLLLHTGMCVCVSLSLSLYIYILYIYIYIYTYVYIYIYIYIYMHNYIH